MSAAKQSSPSLTDPEHVAFRAIFAAAKAVRATGVDEADVWCLLFCALQDQQAFALGAGSDAHRDEVEAQCDALAEDLERWDEPCAQGTA